MEFLAPTKKVKGAIVPFRTGHYTLHEGRARFMEYLAALVARRTRGPVLDVGCGAGYFLAALSGKGIDASGFDISPSVVEIAKANSRTTVAVQDANQPWPYGDGSFNAVTMFDVIEHFAAHDYVLDEARRVLAPGGSLFLITVNRSSVLRRLLGTRWGGFQDPDHVALFDGRRIKQAMRRSGFRLKKYTTFFNFGVAGETVEFLKLFRRPGWIVFAPEFGDSIYVRAERP